MRRVQGVPAYQCDTCLVRVGGGGGGGPATGGGGGGSPVAHRFLLFAGEECYPRTPMQEYRGGFNTEIEAIDAGDRMLKESRVGYVKLVDPLYPQYGESSRKIAWYQVVDLYGMRVVLTEGTWYEGP